MKHLEDGCLPPSHLPFSTQHCTPFHFKHGRRVAVCLTPRKIMGWGVCLAPSCFYALLHTLYSHVGVQGLNWQTHLLLRVLLPATTVLFERKHSICLVLTM